MTKQELEQQTPFFQRGYEWGMKRDRGSMLPKELMLKNDVDFEQVLLGVEASEQEVV